MSVLWLLLGLLAFTGECVAFFPNDLGDGKDKHGNIVVLLILKTAVEKKKNCSGKCSFSPQAVQQILELLTATDKQPLARCLTKGGGSAECGVDLQKHCLGQTLNPYH